MTEPPSTAAASSSSPSTPSYVTLRVSGLGHTFTLTDLDPHKTTVADLCCLIETETSLPPRYQRLVSHGCKLSSSAGENSQSKTLAQAGLKDRTKILLLHSPLYAQEKSVYEALHSMDKEIQKLQEDVTSKKVPMHLASELATRICCQLDAIDVQGSENLRSYRKTLLHKAQAVDNEAHHQADEGAADATAAASDTSANSTNKGVTNQTSEGG